MSVIARISSLATRDRITTVGFALTGGWLFLVALFWLLAPGGEGSAGGIARLVASAGVVLPVALVQELQQKMEESIEEKIDLQMISPPGVMPLLERSPPWRNTWRKRVVRAEREVKAKTAMQDEWDRLRKVRRPDGTFGVWDE